MVGERLMDEKYSITITFEKSGKEETKTFSFKTQKELKAFHDGVYEMYGNDDYQIEGED
jgi:hypothetical protein